MSSVLLPVDRKIMEVKLAYLTSSTEHSLGIEMKFYKGGVCL